MIPCTLRGLTSALSHPTILSIQELKRETARRLVKEEGGETGPSGGSRSPVAGGGGRSGGRGSAQHHPQAGVHHTPHRGSGHGGSNSPRPVPGGRGHGPHPPSRRGGGRSPHGGGGRGRGRPESPSHSTSAAQAAAYGGPGAVARNYTDSQLHCAAGPNPLPPPPAMPGWAGRHGHPQSYHQQPPQNQHQHPSALVMRRGMSRREFARLVRRRGEPGWRADGGQQPNPAQQQINQQQARPLGALRPHPPGLQGLHPGGEEGSVSSGRSDGRSPLGWDNHQHVGGNGTGAGNGDNPRAGLTRRNSLSTGSLVEIAGAAPINSAQIRPRTLTDYSGEGYHAGTPTRAMGNVSCQKCIVYILGRGAVRALLSGKTGRVKNGRGRRTGKELFMRSKWTSCWVRGRGRDWQRQQTP